MSRVVVNSGIPVRCIPINSEIQPLVSMQLHAPAFLAMHKKEKEKENENILPPLLLLLAIANSQEEEKEEDLL